MTNTLLLDLPSLRIEHFYDSISNNKNLAFVFTPSYNKKLEGNGYGGEMFLKSGYDTIAFKVNNDNWFQSIPIYIFEEIKNICKNRGYQKRISYGSSMGGFGSIVFSKQLEVDISIAFSPQYSIDEAFDRRWESYARNINQFNYRINNDSINNSCKYIIFYDPKDRDNLHVEKLAEIIPSSNLELHKIPYIGHVTMQYLAEVGLLKDIVLSICDNLSIENFNYKLSRSNSKTYFHNLSKQLMNRKKYGAAMRAINRAIAIDPSVEQFFRHKSLLLDKMGLLEDAILTIRHAISLDPEFPSAHIILNELLEKKRLI